MTPAALNRAPTVPMETDVEARARRARRGVAVVVLVAALAVLQPAAASTDGARRADLLGARDQVLSAGQTLESARTAFTQAEAVAGAAAADAGTLAARLAEQRAAEAEEVTALAQARAPLQSLSVAAYTLASDGELAEGIVGLPAPEYSRRMVGTATERTLERIAQHEGRHADAVARREAAQEAADLARTASSDAGERAETAWEAVREAEVAFESALAEYDATWRLATVDATDLPRQALEAYLYAAATAPCPVPWWVLAGIGRVESHHGGGRLDPSGRATVHGPTLDGSLAGTAVVTDSDGGVLDGDPAFDRAVGPMQFLPGTWRTMGRDGDADGVADPFDIDDATVAAAAYLCRAEADEDLRGAILAYNPSGVYADAVLQHADRYWAALGDTGRGEDRDSPEQLRARFAA